MEEWGQATNPTTPPPATATHSRSKRLQLHEPEPRNYAPPQPYFPATETMFFLLVRDPFGRHHLGCSHKLVFEVFDHTILKG